MSKIDKSQKNFEELANLLAINYINSSVGIIDDHHTGFSSHTELETNLKDYITDIGYDNIRGKENWRRVSLIIGAGMSYSAFNNILLGNDAKKSIYDDFSFNGVTFTDIVGPLKGIDEKDAVWQIRSKYYEEFSKLRINQKDRFTKEIPDFENSLFLLSNFFLVSDIRKKLFDLYDFRYGPTLFYEIISHMFKHRFVDIIINFNFDELLDQSIYDELGKDSYHSILSDGDIIEMESYLIDRRLKKPIYIKPHGTVSHKSSLRFTKDQYALMPIDMKNFLEDMIRCQNDNGFATSSILIVMGFAMESIEFDDILSNVEEKTTIYFFSFKKSESEEGSKKELDEVYKLEKKIKQINELRTKKFLVLKIIYLQDLSSGKEENILYDDVLLQLWNKIEEKFKLEYKPVDIDRHLLIQSIFGTRKLQKSLYIWVHKTEEGFDDSIVGNYSILFKEYFHSESYFLDRAKIEALIELYKKQGEVSISYLLSSKAGDYFSRFHQLMYKKKSDKPIMSFLDMLDDIGVKIEYLDDVCSITDDFDLKKSLKISSVIKESLDYKEAERLLDNIGKSLKSIIRTNYDNNKFLILEDYKPDQLLHTRLAYEYEIIKRLSKKWVSIIIVEDHNSILNTYLNKIKVEDKIVVVNSIKAADLKSNKKIIKSSLPSSDHDHHLILFEGEIKIESIYYYQKGMSSVISPIVVSRKKNLLKLLEIVERYFYNDRLKGELFLDKNQYFQRIRKKIKGLSQ